MKFFLSVIATTIITINGYTQSIDSLVCRYLVEHSELTETVSSITKTGKQYVKHVNYFIEKKTLIQVSDSVKVQPVIFGCYKSHSAKHLLLQVQNHNEKLVYYYGSAQLLIELEALKNDLIEKLGLNANQEALAKIISHLSSCYL